MVNCMGVFYIANYFNSVRDKKQVIFVTLLILILSTVFGIITSFSDKVVNGISINGINISNLTKQEALSKLTTDLKDDFNKIIAAINKILQRSLYAYRSD